MKAFTRTQLIVGLTLLIVGVAFACLPDTWIESTFNVDPDGGDGWIEAVLGAAPITVGALLIVSAYFGRRRDLRRISEARARAGAGSPAV